MIYYVFFLAFIGFCFLVGYFLSQGKHVYDTIVIGGGPAGLAAGVSLHRRKKDFLIIEAGKSVSNRDRYDKKDLICGIGGAGLFSDGKFSFYPSSTNLWKLPNKQYLSDAYQWFCNILSQCNMKFIPRYPEVNDVEYETQKWILKEYPSIYLSLDQRYILADHLVDDIGKTNILLGTQVIAYSKNPDKTYVIHVQKNGHKTQLQCKNLIIAGGRFWPLFNDNKNTQFMRLEYGVRIQDSRDRSFFTHTELNDPKYKYLDENVEFRTFCCCREGEVVLTDSHGIKTYSGRSDCPKTSLSNTGFNVRILDMEICNKMILEGIFKTPTFTKMPLRVALLPNTLERYYGQTASRYLHQGLTLLLEKFPDLANADLYGPTIEGIGYYPLTDENMKSPDENIWYCGDAGGKFRGITAAIFQHSGIRSLEFT